MHSLLMLFGDLAKKEQARKYYAAQLDHSRAQFCHPYAAKIVFDSTRNVLAGLGQMCYSDPIHLEGFFTYIMRNLAWEINLLYTSHQGKIPVYTIHLYEHLLTQTVMSFTAKTFFLLLLLIFPLTMFIMYTWSAIAFWQFHVIT